MGFKTINGKKVFIDDNRRTKSNGRNDESEGMRIGSGTRVPEIRSQEEIKKQLEEMVIPQLGRSISELENIKNKNSNNVELTNDLDTEIDILLDIKNEVKRASEGSE